MPDLDHDLRTYFDALADQIDDHAEPQQLVVLRDGIDVADVDSDAQPIELADERARRRPGAVLAVAAVALAGVLAWSVSEDLLSVDLDTADPATTTESETEQASADVADGSSVIVVGGLPDDVILNADISVPWQGGTLTLRTVRVLGPAPEDVLERYPPEIQELWADGLPTTWEQADAELQAAGLQQLGFETAEADPVLREWFLDTTRGNSLTHTVDGVVTTVPFDGEFGGSVTDIQSVASDGERLAVAGPGDGPYVVVSVTEDLETWTTIELVDANPADVPAGFVLAPDNAEVTVSEWGWALIGSPYLIGVDPDYLVSLGLLGADDAVISMDTDDAGVLVVETDREILRLSAADLGLEMHSELLHRADVNPLNWSAWAAPWGGEPTSSQFPLEDGETVSVSGGPTGFYVQSELGETTNAFATTGDGWYSTSVGPGGEVVSAGALGLVSGELVEGGGARFWLSEDLGESWRDVEVLGLEVHTTGLDLGEWPVIRSFNRREVAIDFDEGRFVVTAWFSIGDWGLISARLENPVSGEVLAERAFNDGYVAGGFDFLDESGDVLLEVPASTIELADFGELNQTELSALDGPSWRVDTTAEPWLAVPRG